MRHTVNVKKSVHTVSCAGWKDTSMFKTAHYPIHDSRPSSLQNPPVMMELQHRINEVTVVTCCGAACTYVELWKLPQDKTAKVTFNNLMACTLLLGKQSEQANSLHILQPRLSGTYRSTKLYYVASCTFRKRLKVKCSVSSTNSIFGSIWMWIWQPFIRLVVKSRSSSEMYFPMGDAKG